MRIDFTFEGEVWEVDYQQYATIRSHRDLMESDLESLGQAAAAASGLSGSGAAEVREIVSRERDATRERLDRANSKIRAMLHSNSPACASRLVRGRPRETARVG